MSLEPECRGQVALALLALFIAGALTWLWPCSSYWQSLSLDPPVVLTPMGVLIAPVVVPAYTLVLGAVFLVLLGFVAGCQEPRRARWPAVVAVMPDLSFLSTAPVPGATCASTGGLVASGYELPVDLSPPGTVDSSPAPSTQRPSEAGPECFPGGSD